MFLPFELSGGRVCLYRGYELGGVIKGTDTAEHA